MIVKIIKKQLGQGLLEAVFAIGILLMVVSAVLALAAANLVGQRQSELQVIANNLAREGIEVVRHIRDSNWLSGVAWDSGLVGGDQALAVFDQNNNTWNLDFNILPGEDLLYLSPQGVYSHNEASGQPSLFARRLNFDEICRVGSGSDVIKDVCETDEQKIGLKIRAVVNWQESGRPRQVIIENLIYEWK